MEMKWSIGGWFIHSMRKKRFVLVELSIWGFQSQWNSCKTMEVIVSISVHTWIPLTLSDFNEREIDNWTSINIFCEKGTFWISRSLNFVILKHFMKKLVSTEWFYFYSHMFSPNYKILRWTWNGLLEVDLFIPWERNVLY